MSTVNEIIYENLSDIRQNMEKAAKEAARDYAAITLVAVSKVQPDERIEAMLSTGHRIFGENRVQEAQERWVKRRAEYPDLKLHLIGPLQTNKVRDAVALFDVIETLDRPKLAQKLADEIKKTGKAMPCFIQVNTGEEDQKAGISPHELTEFYEYCTAECGLDVQGLMCIPPAHDPAGLHFGLLKNLADTIGVAKISMGMSGDYDKAIRFGATHIRVGSALFGDR